MGDGKVGARFAAVIAQRTRRALLTDVDIPTAGEKCHVDTFAKVQQCGW